MTDMIVRVDDAITVAARRLAIDADTGYTDGRERELAREVRDGIPAGKHAEILRWLVEGAVWGITVGGINMLDECDEGSYAVTRGVADRLFAAVNEQGHADRTLLHLIAHEIVEREDIAHVLGHRAS